MNQKLQNIKNELSNRLLRYAATAGAMTAIASHATAQIVGSGNQGILLSQPDDFIIDMDGDGINDFRIFNSTSSQTFGPSSYFIGTGAALYAYANSWLGSYTGGYASIAPMALGTSGTISGSSGSWNGGTGVLALDTESFSSGTPIGGTSAGLFAGNTGFIGVRFNIGGQMHYGYIRVEVAPDISQTIIHNWAYESQPNTPILAGDADITGPEATLYPDDDRTNNDINQINISFNEKVVGLNTGSFALTNCAATGLTELTPGLEYQLTVDAEYNGLVTITLPAGAVTDRSGNDNLQSSTQFVFDNTLPATTLDAGLSAPTNVQMQTVSISFSEGITGLSIGDLLVTNGTASNLQTVTINEEFTVDITATTHGEVNVTLPANSVRDYADNGNLETSLSWIYDAEAPSATLTATETGVTNTQTNLVTIEFDEDIEGLAIGDLGLTNATAVNLIEIDPATYTVEITATSDGAVSVELPAATVSDLAGNTSTGDASTSWEYDGSAPVATVNTDVTATAEALVTVDITFDESVSGLTLDDFDVDNGSASNLVEVTPGTAYTVDITATANGAVTVTLLAGAVSDDAGNDNAEASDSWIFNATQPIPTLDANVTLTNVATQTVSLVFNESISGLTLDDFAVDNAIASNLTTVVAGTEYTVDVTAAGDGEVSIELPADAVENGLSSGNTAAITSWTYDGSAPTATINAGVSSTTSVHSVSVTISFDEAISGLELDDITITNGTASNLTEVTAGTVFTFDLSATAEGEVSIQLAANVVSDAAGNGNIAAETSYTYDDGVNALNELSKASIKIYPNPTSSMLHLELEEASEIRIVHTSGQLVLQRNNVTNEALDLSHLAAGSYILQIQNSRGTATESIIVE